MAMTAMESHETENSTACGARKSLARFGRWAKFPRPPWRIVIDRIVDLHFHRC